MASSAAQYYGGLIYFGNCAQGLDAFCRIATATFEDYGHAVERQTLTGPDTARITTSRFRSVMRLLRCDGGETRLEIELDPADPNGSKSEAELLLVVQLYRMIEAYSADLVEWLAPTTRLPVRRFLAAFQNVSPRRIRSRQEIIGEGAMRFAPVEETEARIDRRFRTIAGQRPGFGQEGLVKMSDEEALALAFRSDEVEEEPDSDIRRLATWGMTGAVALTSAPVAVSLAAVNLVRGEDFRLNTHVLALTGFVATMSSSGLLADLTSMIPL